MALISTAVASGAWYAYKGTPVPDVGALVTSTGTPGAAPFSNSQQTRGIYTDSILSSVNTATAEEVADSTRRALVVENDQFFTGDIAGDQPLTKETGSSDRLVVEMLTPDQVTKKLRQNEESYAIGRGQGVVRYDVVQLASNHPIEDDHAEKIIGVPPDVAFTAEGSASSDWMFWGVFDGHR